MKNKKFFAIFSASALTLTLLACNGVDKLPTTKYEKVQFAFKGVERSFKNVKTSSKSGLLPMKKYADNEEGLSSLFNLFTEQDKKGDNLDDLEYNQPPMIQFQYIKKALEKIGDNYQFGTKYYDTITGEVYVDMETGYRSEDPNNKYNYTFILGMDINIDNQDFITTDVSFDITLTKDSESYHTKWYVGIELDYDMNNSSPNYKMAMVTENNEKELPFYNHCTYEYDYVDVSDSKIAEWRKFCMTAPEELEPIASGEESKDYSNAAEIDCFAWFKNGSYYKNNHLADEKKASFINILINRLGVNTVDINANRFFNKEGTQNSVLKTCYNEFSKIAKEDIIYDLVTREDSGYDKEPFASIRAMNADLSGGEGNRQVSKNVHVGDLMREFDDIFGDHVIVHLYYFDKNGGMSDPADVQALTYKFKVQGDDFKVDVELSDTLEQCYAKYLEVHSQQEFVRNCEIIFIDESHHDVQGSFEFIYSDDASSGQKPEFPQKMLELGVPDYNGAKHQFNNYQEKDDTCSVDIVSTLYEEGEEYVRVLKGAGFRDSTDYQTKDNEYLFVKQLDDTHKVYVKFLYGKSLSTFTITAWKIETGPAIVSVAAVGDFNNWETNMNCGEFNYAGNAFTTYGMHFMKNEKFKIVVNHEWGTKGGYGYSDIADIEKYPTLLDAHGTEDNILVLENCALSFEAKINPDNSVSIKLVEAVRDAE